MKNLLLLSLLFFNTIAFAQTIRRVNGDPTVTGINVYHTLTEAHDAATAGDILIVEPGNNSFVGGLICNKTLTIYGRGDGSYPGYANVPSGTAAVASITINANNVKISGLILQTGVYDITINGVSGVVISRNSMRNLFINGNTSAPANNITITQNVINNVVSLTGSASGLVSNITLSNNKISVFSTANGYVSSIMVNQNVLLNSPIVNGPAYNCTFINNIVVNVSDIPFSTTNSTYWNNVFPSGSTIDSGMNNNNLIVPNLSSLYDGNYQPISGSVLKTASSSGGEVGWFGGATPYVLYGIPPVPAVTKLRSDGVGNSTTPITITISAKSNN